MSKDYEKRKNKSKLPDGISAINASDYYKEKRLDLDIEMNPLVNTPEYAQHNKDTIDAVISYAERYLESGPKVETKKGIMETKDFM